VAELISNALSNRGTEFKKYYNGSWTEPGKGGLSSYLEPGNPSNSWSAVSFNEYLNEVVLVTSQWNVNGQPDLYMMTSPDGVNFSPRQPLALDPGEQFYPSLIGMGANPQITDKEFYVYYTDSKKGSWGRWKDATLKRRLITLDPLASPISSPGSLAALSELEIPQPQTSTDWINVADYRDDFQPGGPADGWRYAWNSNGEVGASANIASLKWSEMAQAYNTTGAATMVPGSKTHKDDYLQLTAWGGHPGNKGYFTMAGYTIQAEDGAGEYRLTDSSILKGDTVTSQREDGLNVHVFVNNSLIGPLTGVTTNGLTSSFNRNLGQLNVGDTIWVMVDPTMNQYYDSFSMFDFSIQKLMPQAMEQLLAVGAMSVPEPTTATLLFLAIAVAAGRRSRRS
jgi:hypothetical protein